MNPLRSKICIVTGSRAEYDLLKPVILKLQSDEEIECDLVVTGSHLEESFGNTVSEIDRDEVRVTEKIKIPMDSDTKLDMARSVAAGIEKFAEYFNDNVYDMLIVLGDRFEIYAVAIAAAMLSIPIAHLYGGDTTEGAVDEYMRHGITKMSYLHFTSAEEYRKRVIQLGEDPQRVFNVGSLGVENCMKLPLMELDELNASLATELKEVSYAVVTYHPVTMENGSVKWQTDELIRAMSDMDELSYIITLSNADAGGRYINEKWKEEASRHDNWTVIPSLGAVRYLSAVKYSAFVLGNSSSGISEVPSMKVPTVNIGDRQKGRIMADSVISCDPSSDSIKSAMIKALSPEFKEIAQNTVSPFGDGNTSERIVSEIKRTLKNGEIDLKKKFYDIIS
ncbi:MAG: UDP-N-acetylglucosamine 2-epimerase (hydrolyzing) [Lachnospiraceae bacterium]|nr:UDP-N-acetylglucosamine 2-epimerase (hydrolyzing) [Lachnospiraceae bacterium]